MLLNKIQYSFKCQISRYNRYPAAFFIIYGISSLQLSVSLSLTLQEAMTRASNQTSNKLHHPRSSTDMYSQQKWIYNASNPKKYANAERRLIEFLLNDYDPRVRPVYDPNTAVKILFGFSLSQLIDVDEKNQIVTTNSWLNMNWIDVHLKWNPVDFGGLQVVHLPYKSIWLPDIILYNNAESAYSLATLSTNVIVQHDGNVSWLSTNIFESACLIDVKYFPFDTQFCNMTFASWTYSDQQLDINYTTDVMDVSNYMANTEWTLINVLASRHAVNYSCCPDVLFPDVTYRIHLHRKPLFYVFNMLLPCIIITYVALLGFSVPPDSGEKVTMGITTLLSMTVFLMLVAEQLPPNSTSLPMIGIYYGVAITIVSIATGFTVLTLNVHNMGKYGKPLPGWMKLIVFDIIAKLVFKKVELIPSSDSTDNMFYTQPPETVYDHTDYTSLYKQINNIHRMCNNKQPHDDFQMTELTDVTNHNYNLLPNESENLNVNSKKHTSKFRLPFTFRVTNKYEETAVDSNHTPLLEQHKTGNKSPKVHKAPQRSAAQCFNSNQYFPGGSNNSQHCVNELESQLATVLYTVKKSIEKNERRLLEQRQLQQVCREWQEAGCVLDRLFLIIFIGITSLVTWYMIMTAATTQVTEPPSPDDL